LQLQRQPQPEAFFSSCLTITSASPQAAHFLGLQRISTLAPHFEHLNSAIWFSFLGIGYE
jgi:hypothetical protein